MLNFPTHHRSPHLLAALIVEFHQVSLDAIASRDPLPVVALARQDLIVLLSDHTGLTQAEIGGALNRTESTVSHILRTAKTLAINDPETSRRMSCLRAEALCLPTAEELLVPDCQAPDALSRRIISRGADADTLLDRLSLAIMMAVEVLKSEAVRDGEARRVSLAMLTRIEPALPTPAKIIPLKGFAQ